MPIIFDQEVRRAIEVFDKSPRTYRGRAITEPDGVLHAADPVKRYYSLEQCFDLIAQADRRGILPVTVYDNNGEPTVFEDAKNWEAFMKDVAGMIVASEMHQIRRIRKEHDLRYRTAERKNEARRRKK